jgi:competence transcription factor ComK
MTISPLINQPSQTIEIEMKFQLPSTHRTHRQMNPQQPYLFRKTRLITTFRLREKPGFSR